jgi:16S rRNA (guanine(527)-N(7))-methyltransferase RsmG
MDTRGGIAGLLASEGIVAGSAAARQLELYCALLEKWNARINLTSSTEWRVIGPLLHEGIWAARFYPKTADSHLDIGSGAGFPAIPLRIMHPHMRLHLAEPRSKRAIFLERVAYELGLDYVRVWQARLQSILRQTAEKWDCISWKGLVLSGQDLADLRAHAHIETQFWIFHGKELPVENPGELGKYFDRERIEKFPGRHDWYLSVFHVKHPE